MIDLHIHSASSDGQHAPGRLMEKGYVSSIRQTFIHHARGLASTYRLFETAGSDYHREHVKPDIFLGKKCGGQENLVNETIEREIRAAMKYP